MMELIYLYIGNIDRPLKNQGINFGSMYRVNYNPEDKKLQIYENPEKMDCLYGEPFKSLDLIVGKNGTGKSTVLDILGLPKRSRVDLIPIMKDRNMMMEDGERYTWFALYHIEGDWFALEGYWADMLDFMPKEQFGYLQPLYSVAFRYDINKQRVNGHIEFLQDMKIGTNKKPAYYGLFYVLYESLTENTWYDRPFRAPSQDDVGDAICQRIYASHTGYDGIVKYLYDSVHNHEFAGKMASKPGTKIVLEVHQGTKAEFAEGNQGNQYEKDNIGKEKAGKRIYGEHIKLLDPIDPRFQNLLPKKPDEDFTNKETMALVYLEEAACYVVMQESSPKERFYHEENLYSHRRNYLLNLIKEFNEADYYLANYIVEGIEAIPDSFFMSGTQVTIDLRDMTENFLQKLMWALDLNQRSTDHEINHRYYLRTLFIGMSTGEAQYLDLYAALYNTIKNSGHAKGDTCVLLLDEPDNRFHPEWSRNFILNLTELLKTDVFNDYHYQVIITTHSPLLVSDVPRGSIHCLQRESESGAISITKSKFGFMSNINDLITDSFFADSIFGAYSEQYVNRLLEQINKAKDRLKTEPGAVKEELPELRKQLAVIDDDTIRESIDRYIGRLIARAEGMKQK